VCTLLDPIWTVKPNVIFEKLIVEDTDRAHITLIKTRSSAHTSVTSSGHTQAHTLGNRPANLNRKYINIPIINFITIFDFYVQLKSPLLVQNLQYGTYGTDVRQYTDTPIPQN